jgi:hypothetical protein
MPPSHPASPHPSFLINFTMMSHIPATMSLISITKQRYAAAAGGGLHALQFLCAGAFVQATPAGVRALGVGPFMSMLMGITFVATLLSCGIAAASIRAAAGAAGAADPEAGKGPAATASRAASVELSSTMRGPKSAAAAAAAVAAAAAAGTLDPAAALEGAGSAGSGFARRLSLDAALEGIGSCMQGSY